MEWMKRPDMEAGRDHRDEGKRAFWLTFLRPLNLFWKELVVGLNLRPDRQVVGSSFALEWIFWVVVFGKWEAGQKHKLFEWGDGREREPKRPGQNDSLASIYRCWPEVFQTPLLPRTLCHHNLYIRPYSLSEKSPGNLHFLNRKVSGCFPRKGLFFLVFLHPLMFGLPWVTEYVNHSLLEEKRRRRKGKDEEEEDERRRKEGKARKALLPFFLPCNLQRREREMEREE